MVEVKYAYETDGMHSISEEEVRMESLCLSIMTERRPSMNTKRRRRRMDGWNDLV